MDHQMETQTPTATIRIRGLSVDIGERSILRDLTLDAEAGKILALVGPSGCASSPGRCGR